MTSTSTPEPAAPSGRPGRTPRPGLRAAVLDAQRLTPGMVRLTLGGPGLARYEPSGHADSYVKLVFLPGAGPTVTGAEVLAAWTAPDGRVDLDAARGALPADRQPRMRTYTVRAHDAAAGTLTIDLVVHGDEGLAGPWAATARPGDEVVVVGPGGGYTPDPTADHHLLVGDASALPAVAVALERLGADATGHAVLEVADRAEELPLLAPAGVTVHWVHTGDAAPGARMVEAARALPWPEGRVHAFVHGEAGAVRELRRYLRAERRMSPADLSISGYWRLGADDEHWRAGKRAWLRAIEESEAALG